MRTKIALSAIFLPGLLLVGCPDEGDRFNPVVLGSPCYADGCDYITNASCNYNSPCISPVNKPGFSTCETCAPLPVCDSGEEFYVCHMEIQNQQGQPIGSWGGLICDEANLHPSQIGIDKHAECQDICDSVVSGGSCQWPFEFLGDSLQYRVFEYGPHCDSSISGQNPPFMGGSGSDGSGEGGNMCIGDSGTDGYDEDAPASLCPSWYQPGHFVARTDRRRTSSGLPESDVVVDRGFAALVESEHIAVTACDSGVYKAGAGGAYVFSGIQRGDLFSELGFENGDADLKVRKLHPLTGTPLSSFFSLDGPGAFPAAYLALRGAERFELTAVRSSAGGRFTASVSLVDCDGVCSPP